MKLHRQFPYPTSSQLIDLLKNCGIEVKEFIPFVINLDNNCEICLQYKKTKLCPIVGFPLAKTFNETLALELKQWSQNKDMVPKYN